MQYDKLICTHFLESMFILSKDLIRDSRHVYSRANIKYKDSHSKDNKKSYSSCLLSNQFSIIVTATIVIIGIKRLNFGVYIATATLR